MMTYRERRVLGRKRTSKIPTIVYLAVPLALFGTMIELPRAEAQVPMKTNADYCREWKEGWWEVRGATDEMMTELCAKYE